MPITSTDIPPADPVSEGAPRKRSSTPEWLLRVSVESLLIVVSILLALGVDEWREGHTYEELARQSLQIFAAEVEQNLARMNETLPYHVGLRDVVADMAVQPERVTDVHSIVEGLEPVVLRNSAWETALAAGAFRYIDVNTVSQLSLIYGLQQRYQTTAGRPELYLTSATTPEQKLEQMQHALMYLNELVRSEQELHSVYVLALDVVEPLAAIRRANTQRGNGDPVQ